MSESTKIELEFTIGGIKKALEQLNNAYKEIRRLATPDFSGRIAEVNAAITKEVKIVEEGYKKQLESATSTIEKINKAVHEQFRKRANANRRAVNFEKKANEEVNQSTSNLYKQMATVQRGLAKQAGTLRQQELNKLKVAEEKKKAISEKMTQVTYINEANISKKMEELYKLQRKQKIVEQRKFIAETKAKLKKLNEDKRRLLKEERDAVNASLKQAVARQKSVYITLDNEQRKRVDEKTNKVIQALQKEINVDKLSSQTKIDLEKKSNAQLYKIRETFAKKEKALERKIQSDSKKNKTKIIRDYQEIENKKQALIRAGAEKLNDINKKTVDKEVYDFRQGLEERLQNLKLNTQQRNKIEDAIAKKRISSTRRLLSEQQKAEKESFSSRIEDLKAAVKSEKKYDKSLTKDQIKQIQERTSTFRDNLNRQFDHKNITSEQFLKLDKKVTQEVEKFERKLTSEIVKENKQRERDKKKSLNKQNTAAATALKREAQLVVAGIDRLSILQTRELKEKLATLENKLGVVEKGSKQEKALEQELYNYKKKLVKKFVQDNKDAQKKVEKRNKDANILIRSYWKNTFKTIGKLGSMAFGALRSVFSSAGMQLQMMITDTLRVGVEFDKFITTLGAIRGVTRENIKPLEDQARLLGSTTLFTATQAAEGMQALARAGLETGQVIATSSDALKFAGANATTLYQSTSLLAATMKQFSFTANESGRIVDTFTAATQNSMFDVESLAVAMRYAGNVGSGMGAELEETVGVLAQFRDMGLEGSMVGTRFRQAMLRLSAPTIKAQKAMDKLSISYDEINPAKTGLLQALRRLAELNLSQEALVPIVGSKVVADFNKLIQAIRQTAEFDGSAIVEGTSDLEKFIEKLYEARGVNDQTYEIMVKSTSGQIDILKSAYQELQLTIFDAFSGKQAAEAGVDQFATVTKVVEILQTLVYDLTTLFGELGLVLGEVLDDELKPFMEMLEGGSSTLAINLVQGFFKVIDVVTLLIRNFKFAIKVTTMLGIAFLSLKLGQLIYGLGIATIAFTKLAFGIGKATAATTALMTVMKAHPLLLLGSVVVAIGTAIAGFSSLNEVMDGNAETASILESRLNALRNAQELYNQSTKVSYDSQVEHRVQIDNIIVSLKAQNALTADLKSSLNNLKKLDETRIQQLIQQGKLLEVTGDASAKMYMDHRTAALLAAQSESLLEKGIIKKHSAIEQMSKFQDKFNEKREEYKDLEKKIYDFDADDKKLKSIKRLSDIESARIDNLIKKIEGLSGQEIPTIDQNQAFNIDEAIEFDKFGAELEKFTDKSLPVFLDLGFDPEVLNETQIKNKFEEIKDKISAIPFNPNLGIDEKSFEQTKEAYIARLTDRLIDAQKTVESVQKLQSFVIDLKLSKKSFDFTDIQLGFIESQVKKISETPLAVPSDVKKFSTISEELGRALKNAKNLTDEFFAIANRQKDPKLIDVKKFRRDATLVNAMFDDLFAKRANNADNLANRTIGQTSLYIAETKKILSETPKLKDFFLEDSEGVFAKLDQMAADKDFYGIKNLSATDLQPMIDKAQQFLGVEEDAAKSIVKQFVSMKLVEKQLEALNNARDEDALVTVVAKEDVSAFLSFATFVGSFFENLRKQGSQFSSQFSKVGEAVKDAGKDVDKTTSKSNNLGKKLDSLRKKSIQMIDELQKEVDVLNDATKEGVKGLEKQADKIIEIAKEEEKLAKRLRRSAVRRLDTFQRMTESINLLITKTALKTEKEYMKSYDSLKKEIRDLQRVQSDAILKIQEEENKRLETLDNITDKSFNKTTLLIQTERDANIAKYKELTKIVKTFSRSRNASNRRAAKVAKAELDKLVSLEKIKNDSIEKLQSAQDLKSKRRSDNRILVAQATNQKLINLTRKRLVEINALEKQFDQENMSEVQIIQEKRKEEIKKTNTTYENSLKERQQRLEENIKKELQILDKRKATESEKDAKVKELRDRNTAIEKTALINHRIELSRINEVYDKKRKKAIDDLYVELFGADKAGYDRLYGNAEEYFGSDEELYKRFLNETRKNVSERSKIVLEGLTSEENANKLKTQNLESELDKQLSLLNEKALEIRNIPTSMADFSEDIQLIETNKLKSEFEQIRQEIDNTRSKLLQLSDTGVDPYSIQIGLIQQIVGNVEKLAKARMEEGILEKALRGESIETNKEYLNSLLGVKLSNNLLIKSHKDKAEKVLKTKKKEIKDLENLQRMAEVKRLSLFDVSSKEELKKRKENKTEQIQLLQDGINEIEEKLKPLTKEQRERQPALLLDLERLREDKLALEKELGFIDEQIQNFGKSDVEILSKVGVTDLKEELSGVDKELKTFSGRYEEISNEIERLIKQRGKLEDELKGIKPKFQDKKIDKKRREEKKAKIEEEIKKITIQISGAEQLKKETIALEGELKEKFTQLGKDLQSQTENYNNIRIKGTIDTTETIITQEQRVSDEVAKINQANLAIEEQLLKRKGTLVDANGRRLTESQEEYLRQQLAHELDYNNRFVEAYKAYLAQKQKLQGVEDSALAKKTLEDLKNALSKLNKEYQDNFPTPPEVDTKFVFEMEGYKKIEKALGLFTSGIDSIHDLIDQTFDINTIANFGSLGIKPLTEMISGFLDNVPKNADPLQYIGSLITDSFDNAGKAIGNAFENGVTATGKFVNKLPGVKNGVKNISKEVENFQGNLGTDNLAALGNAGAIAFEGIKVLITGTTGLLPQLFKEGVEGIFKHIGNMSEKSFKEMSKFIGDVVNLVKNSFNIIYTSGKFAFDSLSKAFDSAVSYMINADLSLQSNITGGANAIIEDAEKAKERLDHLNEQLAKGEISQAEYDEARSEGVGTADPERAVDNFITDIIDKAVLFMESMAQAAPLVADKLVAQLPRIVSAFKSAFPVVLQELATGIPEIISIAINGINEVLPDILSTISEKLPQVLTNVISLVQESIIPLITTLGQSISSMIESIDFESLIESLSTALFALLDSILSAISSIFSKLPQILGGILKKLPELIGDLSEFISNIVKTLGDMLPDLLDAIFEGDTLSKLLDSLLIGLVDIGVAILDAVPKLITALITAAPKVIGAVVRAIPTLLTAIVAAIPEIITSFISEIGNIIGALLAYIPTLATELWKFITEGVGGFAITLGQAILDGLSALFKFFRDLIIEIVTIGTAETETFGDTPGAVKAPSEGLSARFKGGDFVVAAQKPQEVLRQALELVNNTASALPINSQVVSEFSKLANSIPSIGLGTENIMGSISRENLGIQSPTTNMRDIIQSMGKATGFAMRSAISQAITPLVQAQNMQSPIADTGSFRPINLSVVADGRVLDSIQVSAMNSGNAPKLKRKMRNMSGVNVGFSRGRYNNFSK